jgi:hypothetical protein
VVSHFDTRAFYKRRADASLHVEQSFLLHTVSSFGRLRFSSAQMKMIIWLLKKLNVAGVPSYTAFKKMQEQILSLMGRSPPVSFVSQFGNHFSVLDPGESVALVC